MGPTDCGIAFLHIFQCAFQLFHHSSVLFDGQVQFSSIPRLQLVPWHGNVARRFWTAIRRLRKVASFVCIKVVFWKVYKWALWGRENYRKFLKLSCQEKVGEICSFCCEWTIERCPKPIIPDHFCLPEYHYLSYQKTPKEGRDPDD